MKITIDIDCTPQEARSFLGLPNVEPMQDALVQQMRERLARYLEATDPDTLLRTWFPSGLKGLGELQEQFWSQFLGSTVGPPKDGPKSKKTKE
jgi:hypothetical protein